MHYWNEFKMGHRLLKFETDITYNAYQKIWI